MTAAAKQRLDDLAAAGPPELIQLVDPELSPGADS